MTRELTKQEKDLLAKWRGYLKIDEDLLVWLLRREAQSCGWDEDRYIIQAVTDWTSAKRLALRSTVGAK